ncbi:MAG TPA: alpha/beta hydrolase-fold protein [Lacunisphaera sp.]|nr:alpha/beta hydrolase-fold protein [Lacunisphaera sp.]
MKELVAAFAILFVTSVGFGADAPAYPPHTIANSQLRVLSVEVPGRKYQLHIGLPGNYQRDVAKRYPVIYVTDGYWDFEKLHVIKGSLNYDKVAPEFIIVGLGYAGENLDYGTLRWRELSPVPFGNNPDAGHAADFLNLLEKEIIPLVDRDYRTDPKQRVLAGASLGGLFTLYSMYTKPDLFNGYIAVTPAVMLSNDWLLDYEDKFAKAGGQLKGRLFVSVGENEGVGYMGGILRYNARVTSRKYPGLAYQFRIIDGERHAGMQIESYVRGVRFIFAPLAPEQGPSGQ